MGRRVSMLVNCAPEHRRMAAAPAPPTHGCTFGASAWNATPGARRNVLYFFNAGSAVATHGADGAHNAGFGVRDVARMEESERYDLPERPAGRVRPRGTDGWGTGGIVPYRAGVEFASSPGMRDYGPLAAFPYPPLTLAALPPALLPPPPPTLALHRVAALP